MLFSAGEKLSSFLDRTIFRVATILVIFWIMWIIVFAETEADYTKESDETVEVIGLLSRPGIYPSSVPTISIKREDGEIVYCRFPRDKAWRIGDKVIATKYKSKKGRVRFRCSPMTSG